jgi:hypothetical protein
MRHVLTAALVAAAASRAAAQGTLSAQGYGYPAGPLSTRALAIGGAVGEIDPLTPLNPAALTSWGGSGFYAQLAPEWRTVTTLGTSDDSHLIRFPLVTGALAASEDLIFGLSFSNLLDRTWGTSVSGYQHLGGDSVFSTQNFTSKGSLENIAFSAAYRLTNKLRVGVAGHFYTGQNTLVITETFADSGFASFGQVTAVNLSGTGIGAGVLYSPVQVVGIGISGQLGGVMRGRRNDTLVASARVPDRAGISLIFAGITGVLIAADAEWNGWAAMNGLAQDTILAVNGWDFGVGTEIRVPASSGVEIPVRLGARWRTLPFQADNQTVRETVYSGGVGIPLARGRARIDLALMRALRRADLPVTENAWSFSAGILLRP